MVSVTWLNKADFMERSCKCWNIQIKVGMKTDIWVFQVMAPLPFIFTDGYPNHILKPNRDRNSPQVDTLNFHAKLQTEETILALTMQIIHEYRTEEAEKKTIILALAYRFTERANEKSYR